MALKIRLRRQGRVNSPYYRLVVTENRTRRDGKYVEMVGTYNPSDPKGGLIVNNDRIRHWLANGATLSEKAETLVAQVAPDVIQEKKERQRAKTAKMQMKRRAHRRAAAK